jgi:hypothetical protein
MRQTTLDELENLYDWLELARLAARTRAPARLTLRCAAGRACGATISALPRSVGDRKHHACVLDEAGKVLAEEVIANTRDAGTVFGARLRLGSRRFSHFDPQSLRLRLRRGNTNLP